MKSYYTLIASLPYLPRFDKATRLPITRESLLQRLKMLDSEDFRLADSAADFIAWIRQPIGRTNTEIVSVYNKEANLIFESPLLKPLFEMSINQRTIMTALRRREIGLPGPNSKELWGVGPLAKHIEHNWDKPFFKLNSIFPWIMQAEDYFKSGELLKLEYLLMNLVWNRLDFLLFKNYFGFEVVIAYLLKWDILRKWLSYNKELAKTRLEEIVFVSTERVSKIGI